MRILTVVKYLWGASLAVFAYMTNKDVMYLTGSFLSLAMIFVVCESLIDKHRRFAYVLNVLLFLLFSVQMMVMRFGSSYISMIMVTNMSSVQDLHGRTLEYVSAGLLCLAFSLVPIEKVIVKGNYGSKLLTVVLGFDLLFTMVFSSMYSPLFAYVSLGQEAYAEHKQDQQIASTDIDEGRFYRKEVNGWTEKPEALKDKPNIILIFTEGLSKSIVEDERQIMPNTYYLQTHSLSFNHYYNHTAATYRGLIGQLYSGYQRNNNDANYLVSIQKILKDNGYYTQFINTEPHNGQFTSYLNSLQFDKVIQTDDVVSSSELSDAQAYTYLKKIVSASSTQPTFTVIYTFHTHVSLDGVDEVYGDGSNAMLNKFYDNDVQLGKFMDAFNRSSWSDNTLLVYTSDHATYVDDSYLATFDNPRDDLFVDQIPLYFYYKGIEPEEIDAGGMNTLSLAPTILDYVDISGENYFLGDSLFSLGDTNSPFNTIYTTNGVVMKSTNSGVVSDVDETTRDILSETLNLYFALKIQKPTLVK